MGSQTSAGESIAGCSSRTNAAEGSVEVYAIGAGMARSVFALVYVETSSIRTRNEALTAEAFPVDTSLVVLASCVGCAADFAVSVDAQFSGQTITVAVTNFYAKTVFARFSAGTIRLDGTSTLTETRETRMIRRTISARCTNSWNSHAALSRRWIALEAWRAGTSRRVLETGANCVWPTNVFLSAGITALILYAGLIRWTISTGATAQDTNAVAASLIGLTLGRSDARNVANAVDTFFIFSAVLGPAANGFALSFDTIAPVAFGVVYAVIGRSDAAVAGAFAGRNEAMNAPADWLAVVDLANGIRAASILARIDAAFVVADRMNGTVFVRATSAFRLAATSVGIANVIRLALANGIVG